jgi:4-amino-4-deoxy-L-arabinose transferase-like glycosyltransferase
MDRTPLTTGASEAGPRRLAWAAALFLLALTIRVAHLREIRSSPLFLYPVVDALGFDKQAQAVARGEILGAGPFFQAPLYPYLLGGIYALFGRNLLVARLLQMAAGSLSVVLLFLIGRRIFGERAGVAAGIMGALYGTFIVYEGDLLREFLTLFLNLLFLLLLLRAEERRTGPAWYLAGLALGLSAICRETVLLFAPLAAAWIAFRLRPRESWRRVLLAVALVAAGSLCAILPVTLRNRLVTGVWTLVSYQGGIAFYIGNNPDYDRTSTLHSGHEWEEFSRLPERRAGVVTPAGASAWFYREAFRFIREEPGAWLGLLGKKFVLFWNAWEADANNSLDHWREHSRTLSLLLWRSGPLILPFGLLAPLALLGLFLALGERRGLLPALMLLTYLGALLLFIVLARYRLAAVPPLLLFAGRAVDWLGETLTRRRWRPALAAAGALLCLALLVNADWYGIRRSRTLSVHSVLGSQLMVRDPPRAEAELRLAIAAGDVDAADHYNLGILLFGRNDLPAAAAEFRRALALRPSYADAAYNLGVTLRQAGDHAGAREAFRTAAALEPANAETRRQMEAVRPGITVGSGRP